MSGEYATPEEIEAEIRATRDRIDQRIDHLKAAVSPLRLIAGMLPTGAANDNGSVASLVHFARNNPLPAALVGTAFAWLLGGSATGTNGREASTDGTGLVGEGMAKAKQAAGKVGEQASHMAKEAGDALASAPHRARALGHSGIEWAKDNPIATALFCVAAGAAIASVATLNMTGSDEGESDGPKDTTQREPQSPAPPQDSTRREKGA